MSFLHVYNTIRYVQKEKERCLCDGHGLPFGNPLHSENPASQSTREREREREVKRGRVGGREEGREGGERARDAPLRQGRAKSGERASTPFAHTRQDHCKRQPDGGESRLSSTPANTHTHTHTHTPLTEQERERDGVKLLVYGALSYECMRS